MGKRSSLLQSRAIGPALLALVALVGAAGGLARCSRAPAGGEHADAAVRHDARPVDAPPDAPADAPQKPDARSDTAPAGPRVRILYNRLVVREHDGGMRWSVFDGKEVAGLGNSLYRFDIGGKKLLEKLLITNTAMGKIWNSFVQTSSGYATIYFDRTATGKDNLRVVPIGRDGSFAPASSQLLTSGSNTHLYAVPGAKRLLLYRVSQATGLQAWSLDESGKPLSGPAVVDAAGSGWIVRSPWIGSTLALLSLDGRGRGLGETVNLRPMKAPYTGPTKPVDLLPANLTIKYGSVGMAAATDGKLLFVALSATGRNAASGCTPGCTAAVLTDLAGKRTFLTTKLLVSPQDATYHRGHFAVLSLDKISLVERSGKVVLSSAKLHSLGQVTYFPRIFDLGSDLLVVYTVQDFTKGGIWVMRVHIDGL